MLKTGFSDWPSFTQEEVDAVQSILLSNKVNYWTGEEGRLFEKEFAEFSDVKYSIALANGTVAIDLALIALGIGHGDEVIVTSRTFLASVSSIINAGAKPIFADVDLTTQNISAKSITEVISSNTKAVLCVHLAGWPCDMDPIMELARKHRLFVIEDCAQAHGAKYKGRSVGSIGDIGAWSFCQDKIMTTGGEGGMVTTNNKSLWSIMWSYKDHGKSWNAVYEKKHPPGFRWLHESFGTNWRMTEMQAAIGRIQLKKMPKWQRKRQKNANAILLTAQRSPKLWVPELSCHSCKKCNKDSGCIHANYKTYVFVKGGRSLRDSYIKKINDKGVPCFSGTCSEVYLEKAFDDSGLRPTKRLPNAKKLGDSSIMFLCHPTLKKSEIELTCAAINDVCQ